MELFDSNPANITETTDQPEFFSNWNVQFDGHRANASGAANVSEEETADDDFYRHSSIVTTVYCLAYSFVFLLGLVGNCLVVAVVFRAPRMRTVTNYFIVNLAIADVLVVLFCLPATLLSNIFVPWILGETMCKLVAYVQGVSVVASIDSLVAISLDRVLAICFPMRFQITGRRARLIILLIWIVALTTTIPWPLYFHLVSAFPTSPEIRLCLEEWPSERDKDLYFILANVVFCYLLPLILILLCYVMIWIRVWRRSIPTESKDAHIDRLQQRSKVKVVKMLVVVVIIFMLSWLPLYAIFIRIKLGSEQMESWEDVLLPYVTPVAQWLGASNSCINPVLYAYFNQKYRRGFTAIIQSRSCCGIIRTTAADYEKRYVTTTEVHQGASFERLRRETHVRRSTPTENRNRPVVTATDSRPGTRNNSKTAERRDDHHDQQPSAMLNSAVVSTQDSIELNAIHRKWKSEVL